MSAAAVLFDACVLYPAPLRDLLMHLAMTGLFRAKWSNEIHEEWIENLLSQRPDLTRAQLERTRDLMNAHAADCLVAGYEPLLPALTLPDPEDRHVLAAAIHSGAAIIVTFNLKDFPSHALALHGIESQHPDEFICQLFDASPQLVAAAAKRHRQTLKNPPKSVEEFLRTLETQGLPIAASRFRLAPNLI